ncbi:MAG: hypothetical protein LQ350_003169 [Teloschistes chrysophthalmus]|nr:MAG: hypothetical protein LQ350_003169 [Niorma chrysophthalma]
MTTSPSSSDGKQGMPVEQTKLQPGSEILRVLERCVKEWQAAQAALVNKILAHCRASEVKFQQVQADNVALKAKIEDVDTEHAARKSQNEATETEIAKLKAESENLKSLLTRMESEMTSDMGAHNQDFGGTRNHDGIPPTSDPYQRSSPVIEADTLPGSPKTNDPTVADENPGSLEQIVRIEPQHDSSLLVSEPQRSGMEEDLFLEWLRERDGTPHSDDADSLTSGFASQPESLVSASPSSGPRQDAAGEVGDRPDNPLSGPQNANRRKKGFKAQKKKERKARKKLQAAKASGDQGKAERNKDRRSNNRRMKARGGRGHQSKGVQI